jgi:hypothetical protein
MVDFPFGRIGHARWSWQHEIAIAAVFVPFAYFLIMRKCVPNFWA